MVNYAVEATFLGTLTCALANVDDNKKHEMHLLMQNVVIEVVKSGRIRALIGRFAATEVTKEDILDSLGKGI